jgi:BirA family biotin operon repressor/biotin-[acetyl-CoA-carboxylase] ligase
LSKDWNDLPTGFAAPGAEPLDSAAILAGLSREASSRLAVFEVLGSIDSTNARLLSAAEHGRPSGSVCLAETQTAGRGRRGRSWISPAGGNLYLSLLWRYPSATPLEALSIATGIATARALRGLGVTDIRLKWPNDLYHADRKLGGILLESVAGPEPVVVTGIGLNVAMPVAAKADIDQPWTDLISALGVLPSRNRLAILMLDQLLPLYAQWPAARPDLSAIWSEFDLLSGRSVELLSDNRRLTGVARGIDDSGALRLETPGGIQRIVSGEISLRPLP